MPNIDLLQYKNQLLISEKTNKRYIFDPLRKKHLVLTPEELVRQLFIQYLLEEKEYPKASIAVEKQVIINDRIKRFDLLVYGKDFQPFLLIECKSPKIAISEATFEQAAWYNFELKADYLIVTNGSVTHCCQMNYENKSYTFCETIPAAV